LEDEENSQTLRFGGRAVSKTIAGLVAGANGWKHGGFCKRERDHLLHNPQNQFGAAGDGEFLEQAVQVHVNRVWRKLEALGNFRLVLIVKDGFDDLQLALRDTQGAGNLKPGMVGEQ